LYLQADKVGGAEREAGVERIIFGIGALLAGLGVALGAFAAHGLRDRLEPELLAVFETGVRYQMYHALALLVLALAMARWPDRGLLPAAVLMIVGTVVFSGSLQLLAVTGTRWLGAVTPVGGVCLIAGWAFAAWRVLARGG
jgi:uncharacterized membrane protein YgdD (TMEM256/DUF423 family)